MIEKSDKINLFDCALGILTVTGLYALSGILGLDLIATAPGYATPIWIPSGVALGAVIVWGLRVLPGVFLGSLVVNFYVTLHLQSQRELFMPALVGSVIAIGATLQALMGWYLIKTWVGLRNRLIYPNHIISFAFLSGPISCLINTTWSNCILVLLNVVHLKEYIYDWGTWWMGDSVGVLIFTPIFLILFAKPSSVWRNRVFPILIPLALSFAAVMLLYLSISTTATALQIWPILIIGFLFCVLINVVLFIVYGQKIIVQKRMAEKTSELKFAEAKNLLILRSAGEGIFGVDQGGKITFINPAAEHMLGYEENELIGKSAHDLIQHSYVNNKPYPKSKSPILTTFLKNKISYNRNEVFWRKSGEYFWVDYTCTPLIDNEKTIGAVVVFNDMTQQREIEFKLERMAHYDSLTMLPNRYSFLEKLAETIAAAESAGRTMAVCFIDLDNFKQINDNLGHAVGDETLRNIPKLLAPELTRTDYLARLGGDEFAIILEDITTIDEVKLTMQRYINTLNKPIHVLEHEIITTFSIGVAIYPAAGKTAEELIKNADIAMYKAKEIGKNTFAFYDEDVSKKVHQQHQVEFLMHQAIDKNELSLVYQPLIDCQANQLLGIEVLLRWHNPVLGLVSPNDFITIAEKNGLIHSIGEWVLRQAFAEYKQIIKAMKDKNLLLAVNISIIQFERENFLVKVKDLLKEGQINSNVLIFELTESGVMRDPEYTIKVMEDIKKLGIRFALDDFGVRYSSMQYLKNLPISLLKIDQSFVRDIVHDEDDVAIVNAIVQLAHGLGISTIVEGIETREEFEVIKQLGSEYVQGYYFAMPLPMEELIVKLKEFSSLSW